MKPRFFSVFTIIACAIVFLTFLPIVSAEYEGEFGILYSFSHIMGDSSSRQYINAPETLYFMGFASEQIGVGPEIEFTGPSPDLGGIRSLGGRFTYFFQEHRRSSQYVFGLAHIAVHDYSGSDVAFAVGAGMGYQWRVGSDFLFRGEARYRATLGNTDLSFSNLSLAFGLSVKID